MIALGNQLAVCEDTELPYVDVLTDGFSWDPSRLPASATKM